MRKHLFGIVTFIFAFCSTVSAPAQSPDAFARSDRANVSALLTQFPVGGPDMRATIARIVIAEPSLAREVVALSARATAAQKEAIGGGLSDAASFFAKCGVPCAYAAQQVRNAIASADSDTRAAYVMAETPTMSQGIPGVGNAGASTSGLNCNVISPSRPC